jgi:predicted secreted protein
MPTLRGQNLRIYANLNNKWSVIAQSTNCTINLTAATDDRSHKDIVGMAQMPVVTTKSWTAQVESMDVTDVAALLDLMQNGTPLALRWDESKPVNNQDIIFDAAAWHRNGQALLTDATFNWNNQEVSTKNIQFTGTGAISQNDPPTIDVHEASMAFTQGQNVRLFVSASATSNPDRPIAAAQQLSLHVSAQVENASTKDTAMDQWIINEVVGISYDITSQALVRSGETITSTVTACDLHQTESVIAAGSPIQWRICNVSGANNRTITTSIVGGHAVITQLEVNAPNRQGVTYRTTMQGYGPYVTV